MSISSMGSHSSQRNTQLQPRGPGPDLIVSLRVCRLGFVKSLLAIMMLLLPSVVFIPQEGGYNSFKNWRRKTFTDLAVKSTRPPSCSSFHHWSGEYNHHLIHLTSQVPHCSCHPLQLSLLIKPFLHLCLHLLVTHLCTTLRYHKKNLRVIWWWAGLKRSSVLNVLRRR